MIPNEVKKIFFKEKYANDNEEIRELLYSFDSNKYIIKNSTGLGATHAMCNYTRGNLIILSPNNSMIHGKNPDNSMIEGEPTVVYDCKKFYSICGENQRYKFEELLNYLKQTPKKEQNSVVNLNAEQLIIARENDEVWELLRTFHAFIDESHAYTADSGYRKKQGAALELIYREFTGKKILSTATPIPFMFDIPKELGFETYFIERQGNKPKKLAYSKDRNDVRKFIINQIEQKRKVCVFTNNKDIHVSNPLADVALKYLNLVGENLRIKIQPYDRGNVNLKDRNLFKDADVIMMSLAYVAGFDVPIDCSMLMVSEQRSQHTKIHVNNAVQAYGRCRENVHEALYVNVLSEFDADGKRIQFPTTLDEVQREIRRYHKRIKDVEDEIREFGQYGTPYTTDAGYVNRGEIGAKTLSLVNDYFQYNEPQRRELFQKYNFELYPYESLGTDREKGKVVPFEQRLRNLYNLDSDLYWDYITAKNKLKYKGKGNFAYKDVLIHLAIYLIKQYKVEPCIEMLNNKFIEPLLFYGTLDKWIRVNCPLTYVTEELTQKQLEQIRHYKSIIPNMDDAEVRDWHMLFGMYKVSVGSYDLKIKKHLRLREIAGGKDLILEANEDKNNRTNLAIRNAIQQGKKEFAELDEQDVETIEKAIKSSFKRLDKGKNGRYTNMEKKNINHKKVINLIIQLLHMGRGDYANVVNRTREYGAVTEVGKVLRYLVPLKYLDLDVESANPQFIDSLYGTSNAFDVYSNIMKSKGIERKKAKVMFNTYLNSHKFSKSKARKFYKDVCGYGEDAYQLGGDTGDVDEGSFFEKMTEVEDNLMSSLTFFLEVPSLRLHDGLIIPAWECENYALPVLFNGFRFHVSFFNSQDKYNGETIELTERQFMFSDCKEETNPVNEPETAPTLQDLLDKMKKPINDADAIEETRERILNDYNKTA